MLIVCFDYFRPSQQFFGCVGTGLLVLNQYLSRSIVSCTRTQRNDAGESHDIVYHSGNTVCTLTPD